MKIITHKHITNEPGTNVNRVDMDSDKGHELHVAKKNVILS